MTPQYADQSHGQVRRAGVESTVEDTEEQIGLGTPTASAQTTSTAQVGDVDSILDEIDSVIETNAAAFVQGFVQKGGQ
ncbi:ubiquitin-like protein Pup [Actinomyces viscosus]|uniref:Prokaryotic ubiquitin-like protein Pup n=1 Tax=Actinomyces viscosus TaxID=1656 RepID=A0A3S4X8H8_ACTVI|nr:ubiquitin-like protein Pup [Actinomyces viscosus]TFH53864.1 ubiquitin-like protein Pup [Actinomyces viscosus]VEI15003.1 Bacterial ubiquitin-like modifier [Actinomyces viscosus]